MTHSGPYDASPPDTTHGRTVFFPEAEALVVADLHAGRAAASNAGILLDERQDLLDRLNAAIGAAGPETVVFAGDLCHRFGAPSDRTAGTVRALAGTVRAAGARPVAVSGNHDAGLDDVWPGTVHDAYRLSDDTLVCHGHEDPEADAKRYVCGHLHPAIEVEGRKRDCFLFDPAGYRDRPTLTVPSFSTFTAGLRIERRERVDSPLIPDLDAVRPGVVDDGANRSGDGETLWFPPLAELRPYLRRRR
jgi:metallophosphoesterase superfamily enzyme